MTEWQLFLVSNVSEHAALKETLLRALGLEDGREIYPRILITPDYEVSEDRVTISLGEWDAEEREYNGAMIEITARLIVSEHGIKPSIVIEIATGSEE